MCKLAIVSALVCLGAFQYTSAARVARPSEYEINFEDSTVTEYTPGSIVKLKSHISVPNLPTTQGTVLGQRERDGKYEVEFTAGEVSVKKFLKVGWLILVQAGEPAPKATEPEVTEAEALGLDGDKLEAEVVSEVVAKDPSVTGYTIGSIVTLKSHITIEDLPNAQGTVLGRREKDGKYEVEFTGVHSSMKKFLKGDWLILVHAAEPVPEFTKPAVTEAEDLDGDGLEDEVVSKVVAKDPSVNGYTTGSIVTLKSHITIEDLPSAQGTVLGRREKDGKYEVEFTGVHSSMKKFLKGEWLILVQAGEPVPEVTKPEVTEAEDLDGDGLESTDENHDFASINLEEE